MKKKVIGLILVFYRLLTEFTNSQQTFYDNAKGEIDGYSYELWKDSGTTSMTLMGGGKFSCQWSNINNAFFRIGKKWDCTKAWEQLG